MPGLSDHWGAARYRFVGRTRELEVLQAALSAPELPYQVLLIHGPDGVGKTALLHEYARLCAAAEAHAYYLDARDFEATPEAFIEALRRALSLPDDRSILHTLAEQAGIHVFLIDTAEILLPIDHWLCKVCLPQLPENTLVIMACREPPAVTWQAEAGWQTLIRARSLRNLAPAESRAFLDRHNIPEDQQLPIVHFTHGFPLALALVGEVYAQQRDLRSFEPEVQSDLINLLLERFVQQVPEPVLRAALEACALVRVTTESLLSELLEITSGAPAIIKWLSDLSFIETGATGLFPHDLVREALIAELRRCNPTWYTELHKRACRYYSARVTQTYGLEQQRWLYDFVFVRRGDPAIRSLVDWQPGGSFTLAGLRDDDRDTLVARLAQHHEASNSVLIAPGAACVPLIALSEAEFAEAVLAALRDFTRPDRLAGNPLSQSRLAVDRTGAASDERHRVAALQASFKAAAAMLQASPRDARLYRAVYHTYLQPAPTQEQAAELLEVPFSTYRRHLRSGIQRITATLWRQEIGG